MTRQLNLFFVLYVLLLTCGLAAGQCSPCTIWAPSAAPTLADSGDPSSTELGVKFRSDSNGYVTGVRFYKEICGVPPVCCWRVRSSAEKVRPDGSK